MRITCLVLALSAAAPVSASGQAADSSHVEGRRTLFSIQPLFEGRDGPRLELERAIASRISLVAGSRLTMSRADLIERFPTFAGFDIGARFYAGGRTFHGPYAGVYAGYDRTLRGLYPGTRDQWARAFLGGTVGYDFVFRRRFIIAPAVGAEYGRPSPANGIKTWEIHPRLGIGFNFD
jgi:hypothetical protein